MGQTLKLATKAIMASGAMVLAASCSTTAPGKMARAKQNPTQVQVSQLVQLQTTSTTALASADPAAVQMQPVDLATDRSVAMAYAVPQLNPATAVNQAIPVADPNALAVAPVDLATDRSVAMAYAVPQPKPLTVSNDAAQAIDANLALATPTKPKTRSIEIASVDPAALQIQPAAVQDPVAESVTANAMVETSTRSLEPFSSATDSGKPNLNQLIAKYAVLYDVPEHLIHHVVRRESNYNPAAVHRGNWGLMQIRYNTARGLGYDGSPTGLLDAETNLKYAVKYLKGAWVVAGGDAKKADWLYRTGYYFQAKKKGLLEEAGLK